MKTRVTGMIAGLALLLAWLSALPPRGVRADTAETAPPNVSESAPAASPEDYDAYIQTHADAPDGAGRAQAAGADAAGWQGGHISAGEAGGRPALIWQSSGGTAEWTLTVENEGLYTLRLDYFALEGKTADVRFSLSVNGAVPFRQAASFRFSRLYADNRTDENGFERDNQGNEIKPGSREIRQWQSAHFTDSEGMYDEPFRFYLKQGPNTITLENLEEPVAVGSLTAEPPEAVPAYADLGIDPSAFTSPPSVIKIQAELFDGKSHPSITAGYDRSTPATEPYDARKIKINTLRADQWKTPGERVTWSFHIEEPGYYYIGSRYRQNQVRGFYVSRKITINGRAVSRELSSQRFYYSINWQTQHFGDDGGQALYFEEGDYTLSMEATLGSMSGSLRRITALQKRLNDMYRKIIMITGVQPDPYHDYTLHTDIPELLSVFQSVADQLRGESAELAAITGSRGSEAVLIDRLIEQLDSFIRQPHTIAGRLTRFRENISGLAEWLNQIRDQPLDLDYLYLCPVGAEKPAAGAGFFAQARHELTAFVSTFLEDYNSIGGSGGGRSIEVWVASGRDAAHVLNRMVRETFTRETGIDVNLKLVQGALFQAVMSGRQPDVAVNLGRGEPVNLAMRGALVPLDGLAGFAEVRARFHEDALIPYMLGGRVYALPEQQQFHMMFARTDIFRELGLDIPQTWDDLYRAAKVLQRNNLQIGLPYLQTDAYNIVSTGMSAQNIFPTLLTQRGGSVYNEAHTATALDSPVALEAFQEWVDFYTQYSFPLFKDDYNRFRTGEMPLVITMYAFYGQLTVAAPEIRTDWEMTAIPGTRRADGSIDRAECATGTGAVILKGAGNPDDAWAFLSWLTSADSQAEYGNELEAMVGPMARYATANREAFEQLPWPEQDAGTIREQWDQVTEIPEIPGGYYVSRNLDNAFRACVYRRENTREMMIYWNAFSNEEITRKRREFGWE